MILCVTGPMAAGKNAAADVLARDFGFACVDCDVLVHTAIENAKEKIFAAFENLAAEKGIFLKNNDGSVNRRELGKLIFSDSKLVAMQENIVYPETELLIEKFLEENRGKDIAINATVLYKIKAIQFCSAVIFVDCPKIIRLFRAKKRDGMKYSQICARFKAQKTLFLEYRQTCADIHRVWNFGTRKRLSEKIGAIVKKCRQGIK